MIIVIDWLDFDKTFEHLIKLLLDLLGFTDFTSWGWLVFIFQSFSNMDPAGSEM